MTEWIFATSFDEK